jgi:hypothetical protein
MRGILEECESGRIGTIGNRVKGNLPWVQIPPPPPRPARQGTFRWPKKVTTKVSTNWPVNLRHVVLKLGGGGVGSSGDALVHRGRGGEGGTKSYDFLRRSVIAHGSGLDGGHGRLTLGAPKQYGVTVRGGEGLGRDRVG